MVKIFSPFNGGDTLGRSISELGKQMFGQPNTANQLASEKLYEMQRQNAETDNIMKAIAGSGVQNLGSDPRAQAMLVGSGYDPGKFADIGLMGAATGTGATSQQTQNWQVGSGQSYDNTAGAFGQKLAETVRANNLDDSAKRYGVDQSQATERMKFFETPMAVTGPGGVPTFAPQGKVTSGGFAPILSETDTKGNLLANNWNGLDQLNPDQREVLGANVDAQKGASSSPKNYRGPDGKNYITYNGVTDATTNAPLPQGGYLASVQGGANDTGVTNSVMTDLQGETIANKKFGFLLNEGMKLTEDPNLFGPQGMVRSLGQELMQGAQGAIGLFQNGQPGQVALREAQNEARSLGLNNVLPELYDPNLSKVQTIWGLLVFQGAAALAGQQNRSVSDKDVLAMKEILGSPQSMFSSAAMMQSKLQTAQQIVGAFDGISREGLGGQAAPVAPAAGAVPPPAAAPLQPGSVEDGYQYLGGDPANPASWKQVQ